MSTVFRASAAAPTASAPSDVELTPPLRLIDIDPLAHAADDARSSPAELSHLADLPQVASRQGATSNWPRRLGWRAG